MPARSSNWFAPAALALAALFAAPACGSDGSSDATDDDPVDAGSESESPDARTFEPDGTHHQFVVDDVALPDASEETADLGLDIDGAPDGEPDNALGTIVKNLNALLETDMEANLAAQVDAGGVIMLADVQASSLDNAEMAGFWVLRGSDPDPAPCASETDDVCRRHLDGSGSFSLATPAPEDSFIGGELTGGLFEGHDLGTFGLAIPFWEGQPPISVEVVGARAVATVTEDGITEGRLGGAITESEVQDNLLPQLRDLMNAQVAEDCGGEAPDCCADGTNGEQIVELFDTDASCDVSLQELQDSSLVSGLLEPDVDLLNAEGFYDPNKDGVEDSISLGVGFTAVPAEFPEPER